MPDTPKLPLQPPVLRIVSWVDYMPAIGIADQVGFAYYPQYSRH
ncbi:MAG: hypothetical protein KatS3mg054_0938 [Chloroflexus sp.]|nr:MAG: hypothetical protein KatS3mg054_0938 [Chloroflexus sp.]